MGILLYITIILSPIGAKLVKESKYTLRQLITFDVEGESYRASARKDDARSAQSEVLGIASDARIRLKTYVEFERAEVTIPSEDQWAWDDLETTFNQLGDELDKLIPKVALPDVAKD
ncbi:hypothetical protein ACFLU2_03020 [Chloroflexota bacterium]